MEVYTLSKTPVKFEGVKHWQYDFKNFSIHTATAGAICYSPALAEQFLPYIQDSEVCSEVICRIIKSVDRNSYKEYGIDPLLRSLSEYEQEQAKMTKEAETRRAVEKVLAERYGDGAIKITVEIWRFNEKHRINGKF